VVLVYCPIESVVFAVLASPGPGETADQTDSIRDLTLATNLDDEAVDARDSRQPAGARAAGSRLGIITLVFSFDSRRTGSRPNPAGGDSIHQLVLPQD
jgi:hypothetical protein